MLWESRIWTVRHSAASWGWGAMKFDTANRQTIQTTMMIIRTIEAT